MDEEDFPLIKFWVQLMEFFGISIASLMHIQLKAVRLVLHNENDD